MPAEVVSITGAHSDGLERSSFLDKEDLKARDSENSPTRIGNDVTLRLMLALILIVRGVVTRVSDSLSIVVRGQAYHHAVWFGYHQNGPKRGGEFRMAPTVNGALDSLRQAHRESFGGVPAGTGSNVYCVDLGRQLCECSDSWWRGPHSGASCKHVLAVGLLAQWGGASAQTTAKARVMLAHMVRQRERNVPRSLKTTEAYANDDDTVVNFVLGRGDDALPELPTLEAEIVEELRGEEMPSQDDVTKMGKLEEKARHGFRDGSGQCSMSHPTTGATSSTSSLPVAVLDPKCPANLVSRRRGGVAKQNVVNASKIPNVSRIKRGFGKALADALVKGSGGGKKDAGNRGAARGAARKRATGAAPADGSCAGGSAGPGDCLRRRRRRRPTYSPPHHLPHRPSLA